MYKFVKVNPGGGGRGGPQDYDRDTSDYSLDSDNSSTFRYHSDILQMVEI